MKVFEDASIQDAWTAIENATNGTLSRNTERALRSDWRIFTTWCVEMGVNAVPATPETIASFIEAMAEEKATSTIRRYITSIGTAYRAQGVENTAASEPVRQAIKRMHRAKGRRQTQARGLTRPLLERMLAAGGASLIEVRNRALLAVAYDTLLRRSELVGLLAQDLIGELDGSATVLVRRTKTDPEGYGAELWIAPDSMRLLQTWLDRSQVREGHIFRSLRNRVPGGALAAGEVPRIFRGMAYGAKLPHSVVRTISAHSTRIGGAQDMVAEGIAMTSIMQTGRWKTEQSVMRYAERMLARRGGAAQLARIQRRT